MSWKETILDKEDQENRCEGSQSTPLQEGSRMEQKQWLQLSLAAFKFRVS